MSHNEDESENVEGGTEKPVINIILDKMKLEFNRLGSNEVNEQDSVKKGDNDNQGESRSTQDEELDTFNKPASPTGESPPKLTPIVDGDISLQYESKMDVEDCSPPNLQATSPVQIKEDDIPEEKVCETPVEVEQISMETTPIESIRGLRSQTVSESSGELSGGRKRSARRWSKEGESVLQNAIARKEKCLSAIGNMDDTKALLTAVTRSLRENRGSRAHARSKSPRLSSSDTIPDRESKRRISGTLTKPFEQEDIMTKFHVNPEFPDETESENGNISLEASPLKADLITPLPPNTPCYLYTKTGKRKYKPFRGLRYSFTNRRKKSRTRPSSQGDKSSETASNCSDRDRKVPSENLEMDTQGSEISDSSDLFSRPDNCRSNSPAIAEACNSQNTRKKHQLAKELHRSESTSQTPSPSPADVRVNPSKPESTAISIGAGTAALCMCQSKTSVFLKQEALSSSERPLLCQAIDSLEGRLVGCCNPVPTLGDGSDVRLWRPGRRVPFMMVCKIHEERLLRHNCCPGCGNFCTQGRFVQCSALHHYHRDCQLTDGEKPQCPHCGLESPPNEVTISLGRHKHPLFLPEQKLVQRIPSAKMSVAPRSNALVESRPESPCSVPIVLLSGRELSVEGLFTKAEKEKLKALLIKVERLAQSHAPRNAISSLYQAAEVGDVEKIIQIVYGGMNPSHIFPKKSHRSALHAAAAGGHLMSVHVLVQAGAQLDPLDVELNSPLMLAVQEGRDQVVKYLVKAGASLTTRGADGMTALHLAAKAGKLQCCHVLLSSKNSLASYANMTDEGGWTALVWSCEFGHADVARYLLDNGADPLVRDREQNIALHWSAYSGSEQITEVLLDRNCDINTQNIHGDTPLHVASRQSNLSCVMLLLLRGADCRIPNSQGRIPEECSPNKNTCYTTISLTSQLRTLADTSKEHTPKILTNDITRGKEENEVQCINNLDEAGEPLDYKYITENCFTSNISLDRSITSMQSCKCEDLCSGNGCACTQMSLGSWYDAQGRLLPHFNFADPPMLFECNQLCSCAYKTCKNRVVQRGIKARFQLFRTSGKGWGVQTLQLISRGSYVCEYIGEIISDCEADHREDDSYLFDLDNRDGETYCIDARHYGNIARFINHMCVPNLQSVRVFLGHQDLHFPRIAFFANRDIQPYEELGFDYGEKFWIIKCKSFFCTCGAPTCRYSETTIQKTLTEYNRKLQDDSYF